MDDTLLIACLAFVFIAVPLAVLVGYKNRRRLFSNVHDVSETAFMNLQNESKRRAMEQVQYARDEEEEEDPSGAPAR